MTDKELLELAAKDEVIAEAGEMLAMRDRQLAALKAELREICAAIDDPACDLTLTAVECIKKLKAENESLRKDAERLNFIQSNCRCDPMMDGQHKWWPTNFNKCLTGPSIRAAIDAAMIAGDKNVGFPDFPVDGALCNATNDRLN